MKAIINNIIDSYRMEADAWSILLDNTQRALEQAEKKRKADQQAQRVESLVRNLIMDLNNLLARFTGGFLAILLWGNTDFSQTGYLDGWDDKGVRFIFGINAMPNLVEKAEKLPDDCWRPLLRPAKYAVKTQPRRRPENVKERIVLEREYENIRLRSEDVAEFAYRPTKCRKTYRIVVLRKNLSVEKREQVLFDDIRYFFYITNDQRSSAAEIVHSANRRCD